MRGQRRPADRNGWVQAPSTVELEIRTVWQEDEMPEELTGSPGYLPFTLGAEAQAWVDSMAEVVDGGKAVYGRPKPVAPPVHRALGTPAPTPPPAPRPLETAPPAPRLGSLRATPPPRPPQPMPEIAGSDPVPPPQLAPRPRTLPKRVVMPEIGKEPADEPVVPEIAAEQHPPLMPEIGEEPSHPRPPLMPEIE